MLKLHFGGWGWWWGGRLVRDEETWIKEKMKNEGTRPLFSVFFSSHWIAPRSVAEFE